MVNIFVFGASTTYGKCDPKGGWVQGIREYVDSNAKNIDDNSVFNLGISGNTIENVIDRFESETKARIPEDKDMVIIFSVGANDSIFLHDEKRIRTTDKDFQKKLKKLFDLAKKFTEKIVFVGYSPIDDSKLDPIPWEKNKSFKNKSLEKFNNLVKEICERDDVHFIDIFLKLKETDYMNNLYDGLHPNTEGHAIMSKLIQDFLIQKKLI